MTTGDRIRIKRKERGMSAESIAEQVGLSPATIYRYENGDIEKVPGDALRPIAEALHTTPAYLMGWEDEEKAADPEADGEMNEMLEYIRRSPELRAMFMLSKDATPEELKQYINVTKRPRVRISPLRPQKNAVNPHK